MQPLFEEQAGPFNFDTRLLIQTWNISLGSTWGSWQKRMPMVNSGHWNRIESFDGRIAFNPPIISMLSHILPLQHEIPLGLFSLGYSCYDQAHLQTRTWTIVLTQPRWPNTPFTLDFCAPEEGICHSYKHGWRSWSDSELICTEWQFYTQILVHTGLFVTAWQYRQLLALSHIIFSDDAIVASLRYLC